MKKQKNIKFYNVLFPFWMLMLFPQIWLIVLPGNFIIDSVVLLICMITLKIADKKLWYKKHIVKIYIFGLLADVVGSAYMFLLLFFEIGKMGDELYLTLPALVISSALIFALNYFVTFKNSDKRIKLKTALTFAIVTAPYTFLIPSNWIY